MRAACFRRYTELFSNTGRGSPRRFGHGAVEKAARKAKYASQVVCEDDAPVPRPFLDEMRTSLAGVTAPGKRELLGR